MHDIPKVEIFGLPFDLASIIAITVTCIIVYLIAWLGTRNLSIDNPGKMQKFMEWIIDFVRNNIISSTMDPKMGRPFVTLGLTLIMFIFIGNMLGLPFGIVTAHEEPFSLFGLEVVTAQDIQAAHDAGKHIEIAWWKSPTADASVTMMLALLVIVIVHFLGITRNTKTYFVHYLEPHPAFLPLNIIKEISKLLTLGLRLFGNIFAGEMLIAVILMAGIIGILPMMIWQGFSIFVGTIQAFIFTILTMVYLSQALTKHDEH